MPARRSYCALFGLLWLCYGYVHQGHKSPIALSRLDALQARWNNGSWVIDDYHKNTPDKALVSGHYYSDKAPGTLLLGGPGFFAAATMLELMGEKVDSERGWLVTSWASSVFGVGFIAAIGGVACFAWLRRKVSELAALLTTLALFLGAAPWPYSTMLFSHGAVVGLICIALWAVDTIKPTGEAEGKNQGLDWRREALAGLSLGLALASEYTAGLVIVGLWAMLALEDWRRALRVGFWMLPMLAAIPTYSWMCFGTPYTIGYAHNTQFVHLKRGFFGIGWPDIETSWRLLFSPARGLFLWTPFLLLALPGLRGVLERSQRWFWACYLIPVAQVAVLSGNNLEWMGGPCLGPRYLAPILPLLAFPAAVAAERLPRVALILTVVSVILTGFGTLVNASLPLANLNPLPEFLWPCFANEAIPPNVGRFLGLPAAWSVVTALGLVVLAVCLAGRQRTLTESNCGSAGTSGRN